MSWNSVPQPLVRRSRVADANWISVVSISSGAAALSSWILAPYSVQFLKLHWPTLNDRLPEWTLLGVTAIFSLIFLNTLALYFMAPHPGRADKLSKRESVLFGEPVTGAKQTPKPEPAPVHLSPITPPEAAKALPRYTPGSGTGGYLPSSGYGGARSPLSPANMNTGCVGSCASSLPRPAETAFERASVMGSFVGARVLSPYSPSQGAGMTTPEKMAGAVPDFNLAAADGGGREPGDATPAAGLRAGSLGQVYPGADAGSQWRLSPYSSSPQGSPYYTPGQPSKYHYSAAALQEGPRRDGVLQPSTQKQQEKVLIRLSLTAEILDQWTEALRGWLSGRVVRPLAAALGCPFPQDVTQGPQPEPLQRHIRGLCQRINQETAKLQKQLSAAAPSAGTTSLFGAAQQPAQPPPIMSEDELPAVIDALDAPDQAVQRQMELLAGGAQQVAAWAAAAAQRAASRASPSLFGGFSSFGAPASTAAAASAPQSKALEAQAKLVAALAEQMCEACNKYLKLRQLVLGQLPGGSELLPPGVWGPHIVQRVQALASGHFLYHFKWNASTDHRTWLGAKPSQPPSDAALLLYLFGNYILHPRWDFPAKDELERPPRGDPLFVGSIPAQCPEKFVAVLPGSPPNIPSGSTALLAHNLTHHLPMYSLVLEGLTVLTLSHSSAVFHILLLMLRYCQQQRHGMVAGVTLKELGLEEVMGPVYRRLVSQHSWWGLWQS